MGKKGNKRKTRWRVLPIGGDDGDCLGSTNDDEGDGDRGSASPTTPGSGSCSYARPAHSQRGSGKVGKPRPGYQQSFYRQHSQRGSGGGGGGYNDTKQPLVTTEKKTFNEEEYTKITTPRQDVLFKKGYLGRKKPALVNTTNGSADTNATPNADAHALQNGGAADSERMDVLSPTDEPPHFLYTNGYVDQGGVYYINGGSYELYDPYTGNVTVVVGPTPHYAGAGGGPPMLAAVSCQPVPLQPLEWFNPTFVPYVSASCPRDRDRRKRSSTDSQNCSPQSSESTEPPGSPQEGEELGLQHGGAGPLDDCPVYQHSHQPPAYVYPGYMFGPPVYNMNGITVQGIPTQPQTIDISGSKRRKKKRRRRRRRGGVDDGSEESSSDEKELEEPVSLTSQESSQELESDSKHSAESAGCPTDFGTKELPAITSESASNVTEENDVSLHANNDSLKTGVTDTHNVDIGTEIDERSSSTISEENKNIREIAITSSSISDFSAGTALGSHISVNIKKECGDVYETKETVNLSYGSPSNSSIRTPLVHNTCEEIVSTISSNTELSSIVCSDKTDTNNILTLTSKHVVKQDSQCNSKDAKCVNQAISGKEKSKGKRASKLNKQKHLQNIHNGCAEVQLADVNVHNSIQKMKRSEDSKSAGPNNSKDERDNSDENKLSILTNPSNVEENLRNTTLSTDSIYSTKTVAKISGRHSSHTDPPKKPPRKDHHQQQKHQQKKLSSSIRNEEKQELDDSKSSKLASTSFPTEPSKMYVTTSAVPETEHFDPSGEYKTQSTVEEMICKIPNLGENSDTLLPKIEPKFSDHEDFDSALSLTKAKQDTQTASGTLSSVSSIATEDGHCRQELYIHKTIFEAELHHSAPDTSDAAEVRISSIAFSPKFETEDSGAFNQSEDFNKSIRTMHVDRSGPYYVRSNDLSKSSLTLNKSFLKHIRDDEDSNLSPPVPPPRRKKWNPGRKRSATERPPTPGIDLEARRSSEVHTDDSSSTSTSTSRESEESVIELLSSTPSPDCKGIEMAKQLSSEDEEGVIFETQDVLENVSRSLIQKACTEAPQVEKYKLDTVYEIQGLGEPKLDFMEQISSQKETNSTRNNKLSSDFDDGENVSIDLSLLSDQPKQECICNHSHYSCTWDQSYHEPEREVQNYSFIHSSTNKLSEWHNYAISVPTAERFADDIASRVIDEALSAVAQVSKAQQLPLLPITEAVTRWLHSQSTEEVLSIPELEDSESDSNEDVEEGVGKDIEAMGGKTTGPKNVLRNPLHALSHKNKNTKDDAGIRVATLNKNNNFGSSNNKSCTVDNFKQRKDKIYDVNNNRFIINKCKKLELTHARFQEPHPCDGVNVYTIIYAVSSCSGTVSQDKVINAGNASITELRKETDVSYQKLHFDKIVVEDILQNAEEDCDSIITGESVEYDADWECDPITLQSSPLVSVLLRNVDYDYSLNMESPDSRCLHMCDPTTSVEKYYRLGPPTEKVDTMSQDQMSNSNSESEEESDALEHFRNKLPDRSRDSHCTQLPDELAFGQKPLPESWSIDHIKISQETVRCTTDKHETRYDYKISDSGIQSEESGNEDSRKTSTNSSHLLSQSANVFNHKSTILMTRLSSNGPFPCGGICCIIQ